MSPSGGEAGQIEARLNQARIARAKREGVLMSLAVSLLILSKYLYGRYVYTLIEKGALAQGLELGAAADCK